MAAGKRRYNVRIWKLINEMFDCLPFSAVIEDKILCVHAVLSPELQSLDQLAKIPRPTDPVVTRLPPSSLERRRGSHELSRRPGRFVSSDRI